MMRSARADVVLERNSGRRTGNISRRTRAGTRRSYGFHNEGRAKVTAHIAQKLGFEKISEQVIDECKPTAVLYKHLKTDAEIMSLKNGDENKVFGIVFRTLPKYPLKQPYTELLKGSLHTFLNAFTYPDRTCFPVASTNLKDFYNLVDVALDAVFFPKCVEDFQIFQPEGWHYELNDPSEEIPFKGVILNEMKGAYSELDNILGRVCQQALFPDNAYGVDSAGDPKFIPKLTFEEFKDFYHKYYHPSNAKIWFYGDDDPSERLRILSAYLDQYDKSPVSNESRVEPQKLLSMPVRVIEKYAAGEGDDNRTKHMVCMSWLLSAETLDLETELALKFLNHLLLGTPASPLRRILLESRLGDAIVGGGVGDELLQPQFSIGLKGDELRKLEELIMSTLKKLAAEGSDSDAVQASVNTIEFSLRENNTGSFPEAKWIYDKDPFEPLKYEKPLQSLKALIAAEDSKAVFCPLLEKLILNNAHCVTVEMRVKSSMSQEDLAELVCATQELRLRQETPDPPEALKCVPSLSLDDIPRKPIQVPTETAEVNGVKVLQHDLFTNDVLYLEVVFHLCRLRQDLLQLIPLFCKSLLEMETEELDFVQLNQLIGRKTGGISIYPFTSPVRGKAEPSSHVIVHGKAMGGRVEDLFNLIRCILQDVQFTDQQRFEQLVSQSKAGMEVISDILLGSGDAIAAARMDANYLELLRNLEKRVDKEWPAISSSLDAIRINMTADGKILTESSKYLAEFIDAIPSVPSPGATTWSSLLSPMKEAIVVPTQVNYVGKAANIYEAGYQLHGSSYVISEYIDNTWLWDRIRVSGGGYGTYSALDTDSGVFSYMSYRDPNLLKTVDVYDATANFLRELELDDDALTKAIIGTIGDVDPYQLPDAKGYSSLMRHLLGITEEERQIRREEILSTSVKHFREFADALEVVKDKGVVVAVASADDVAKANEEKGGFFEVKKVL
ncbi:unnamed protein product [Spirodela intermedia]|uniref:Peptidase M16C associated domain-containing protein n=1 Tax=Spirodela intermedia TaxID=51605 RepID=A0A7I8J295_SPIIN|nr:unnamed protein product [Spirodela intermedia]CAA6664336.1 unnamed protein product [Spirodela intermedia]